MRPYWYKYTNEWTNEKRQFFLQKNYNYRNKEENRTSSLEYYWLSNKQKTSHFISKIKLIQKLQRTTMQDKQIMENQRQDQKTEERGLLLRRKGRRWEALFQRIQGGNSFSLEECGSFPMAGSLLNKVKFFLLHTEVCKVSFLLFRVVRTSLQDFWTPSLIRFPSFVFTIPK